MRAEVPIFQSFWKGFRENYRRSLVGHDYPNVNLSLEHDYLPYIL